MISVDGLVGEALDNQGISIETALELTHVSHLGGQGQFSSLLAAADRVRRRFFGNKVAFCSIVNARSNLCGEDCAFCAQSVHASSNVPTYPLLDEERLLESAGRAKTTGAGEFSIVTSGKKPSPRELDRIASALEKEKALGMERCVSVGTLNRDELAKLRRAGLQVFHHNLEAAPAFYEKIVHSRTFQENLDAVKAAKDVGLEVCCGGIFGMGETWEDRVELFRQIREVGADRVPINFLNPIPGTGLEGQELLTPLEGLKIVAIARLMLPDKPINIAGGRELVLGQLQSMVFMAGATSILIGDYLTTKGRSPKDDLEMVKQLGLEVAPIK